MKRVKTAFVDVFFSFNTGRYNVATATNTPYPDRKTVWMLGLFHVEALSPRTLYSCDVVADDVMI